MTDDITALPASFYDVDTLQHSLFSQTGAYWQQKADARVLDLFRQMAHRVPAYKDFLHKQKIKPELIQSIADFKQVPLVDKDSYLRAYPLDALAWDGTFSDKQLTISSTSGSTGEPFYFPREKDQDLQYAATAELYLKLNFQCDKKSTLYIVGFPMGQWIGGVFTYEALRIVAERTKMPLSIITPGVSNEEILKAIKKLGPYFDQVIIGSYGPFLKDTLDEAHLYDINWDEYSLGFIFAAEVFTESFRDYVTNKTGIENLYTHTLNQYGTVDLGTMSYETPLSILARREALSKQPLFDDVFNNIHRVPTLTQFFPELFYFEDLEGNLICSAYSGLPLVRYDLKDKGGVLSYDQVVTIYGNHGVDLEKRAKEEKIDHTLWKAPFVYVYERSDFSVSLYAFNVYPETIRRALYDASLQDVVTGKFTMEVNYTKEHDQQLDVHVELTEGAKKSEELRKKVAHTIRDRLLKENSAYKRTHEVKGSKVDPNVIFWEHRDPQYFNPRIKQKWVQK